MKTQEEYERIITELSESNYNLTIQLAGHRVNGHISHLFGMPLNEVADIIIHYEKEKQMFKGEFRIGGKNFHVKDKIIKLFRLNNENEVYTTEVFKNNIETNVMGWCNPTQELFYRDENGKLWKATFEETDA